MHDRSSAVEARADPALSLIHISRIFGRLDVEGALKEEQAKAEAPKANEEKTEAAQETIRLSGEDMQKLKTQAREDHFGVKGKKLSLIHI